MKLTKIIEEELRQVMNDYWNAYLEGDLGHWANYLVENYRNIGGTEEEIWNSKQEILEYTNRVIDQMEGMMEIRNKTSEFISYDPYVMVHEYMEIYLKVKEDWVFYQKFRISTLLQKIKKEWKVLHQHGSYPDSKTQEGEAVGTDVLRAENEKLLEAVTKRTTELEQKNRELQIEGALQRIRAQATAMQKPTDLLDVVVTMRTEFIKLGHEAHYFWHMLWTPEIYQKAMTSGDGTRIGFVMELPRHIHGDIPLLADWEKSDESTVIYPMDTEGALAYIDKMVTLGDFQNIDPQAPSDDDIRHIGGLTFIMARTTHGEIGYSLPGVVTDPPPEDLDLLVRFAGAFDLAHLRFLDLKKAEAQAREVQVELALEKVRSRTMAMQKSEELPEAANYLFLQVQELGIPAWSAGYCIWEEDKKNTTANMSSEGVLQKPFILPNVGVGYNFQKPLENGEHFHIEELGGETIVKHYEFMRTLPIFGEIIDRVLEAGFPLPTFQIFHIVYFNHGYVMFITYEAVPDAHDIFQRFGKVFEQTYTRFLDLKKAEAQAKEVQIELALEKVRSRTMAMQKSEELADISFELFSQVQSLGVTAWHCAFNIYDKGQNSSTEWGTNTGGVYPKYKTPREGIFLRYYEIGQTGETLHVEVIGEDKCSDHYEWLCTMPGVGEQLIKLRDSGVAFPNSQIDHVAFFKYGYLLFITYEQVPEAHDIFTRFAKVFEQAYTRFLDLQKAEAQAREAQIETSLERVRSRSMAMHNTSELQEVIHTVHKELLNLNISISGGSFIAINSEIETEIHCWGSGGTADTSEEVHIPLFEKPFYTNLIDKIKKGSGFFTEEFTQDEKKEFFTFLLKHEPWSNLDSKKKKEILSYPGGYTRSCIVSQHTSIFIINHFGEIFSNTDNDILKRFGKVFDQTYTRFLDLQKAEAQTREAQIEAALERIRARAMSMHHSDELLEVTNVLRDEIGQLDGLELESSVVHLYPETEKTFETWYSFHLRGTASDQLVNSFANVPVNSCAWTREVLRKYHSSETEYSITSIGKKLNDWYKVLDKILPEVVEYDSNGNMLVPSVLHYNFSKFSGGALMMVTHEPISEETRDLWRRAALVFNISYTRFLDLQNAEAQARESQIELALERVRAKSMAMQKSDELKDVIKIVYEQLTHLKINLKHAGFVVDYKPKGDWNFWIADEQDIPSQITTPYFDSVWANQFNKAKEKGENFFSTHLNFEEKNKFYNELLTHIPGLPQAAIDFYLSCAGLAASTVLLDTIGLYIENFESIPYTDEENNILMRFGTVFQQTYTRFLDLQNAEARAREAQIEAALEKVRSRTMAMQQSDELSEAANIMFLEVQKLGIPSWSAGYNILAPDNKTATCWMSSEGVIQDSFVLSYKEEISFIEMFDFFNGNETFLVQELSGEAIAAHYEYMRSIPQIAVLINNLEEAGISLPTYQINHLFKFRGGYLLFITYEEVPEANDIFKRFTKVFEQTYTRFLDLQNAEARAREAQIEAALEKVRSRSLAMHKSNELNEVVTVLFEKLKALGIPATAAAINIFVEDSNDMVAYVCGENENRLVLSHYRLPYFDNPIANDLLNAHKNGLDLFIGNYNKNQTRSFYENVFELPELQDMPKDVKQMILQSEQYTISMALAKNSNLTINDFKGNQLSETEIDIVKRFAKVFEQSYTRFLDLQKAEVQTREAQIEAALERTRTQSMLMQHSDELDRTIQVFHEQLHLLGIASEFSYLWLPDEEKSTHLFWATWFENQTNKKGKLAGSPSLKTKSVVYPLDKTEPSIAACYVAWKSGETIHVNPVPAEGVKEYFDSWPELLDGAEQFKAEYFPKGIYYVDAYMKYGCFGIMIRELLSEDEKNILSRFTKEFERTYTRFLDLQKAEEQAREAQIEAALEKVRSRTMAMQHPDELEEVVTVVVEKLTDLGVVLDANGVIICTYFPDSKDVVHWMASPDFTFSGRYLLPYFDHPIFTDAWNSRESGDEYFSKSFTVEEKNSFFKHAFEHSDYRNFPDEFKDWIFQNDKHSLSFAWSKSSAILVPSHTGVTPNEPDIEILKRFAKVFEQAYIRFLDLQVKEDQAVKLFEEKQRLEKTLDHLQTTQKQLIQSEKMASLGELTAGIAHEIQNPLNFVNNFSEVSNELIDEMNEEIEKGDLEEAKFIAKDIKQNLEKINHHGKRADAIVKGMLQHSRKSTAKKEPTDINALADEYLRLAYHGLRAKDKSFNATMETDFDQTIGKVNVIPQDIGRVLLNLITNAFHAVKERSKAGVDDYSPLVSITTKLTANGQLLIAIKDNGSGIPEDIKNKIFQPFFTTKPTGEGTGLGLSLSYDIMKAHGGELSCSSKVNEGTKLIIKLPLD